MLFFYRLWALLLTLFTAACLFFIFYKGRYLYSGAFFCFIIIFLGTYFLLNPKLKNWRQSVSYSFFSFLLLASGIFYLVFAEDLIIKAGIIILVNSLLFIYLNEFSKQFFTPQKAMEERQLSTFLLIESVIVFFISAGLLGLRDFLNLSLVILILPFALLIFTLFNYLAVINKKPRLNKILFSLIITLVMIELFWAMAILSLVYYLKGLIISFLYLLTVKFLISNLSKRDFYKVMRNYLAVILIILGIILFTSRWF
ncbi:hypothetical protein KJ840_04610 [Patescibacteria group bacterium]|nr:hypothetical protein [Patescibacteria group bacterium]